MSSMNTKYSLEKYRLFPYVAWGTVILFSAFVVHLTQSLFEATTDLRNSQAELEAQVHMPVDQVDFNHGTSTKKTVK